MDKEISPLGHQIGEVFIPERPDENGVVIGFVWHGDVYTLADRQELLEAQQAKAEKHPLAIRLSRRRLRQLKTQSGVRYLGQPKPRY